MILKIGSQCTSRDNNNVLCSDASLYDDDFYHCMYWGRGGARIDLVQYWFDEVFFNIKSIPPPIPFSIFFTL